ncbi:hypothetical protein [Massilia brevitalea]|uniref:hypothetical protein n=1 Tax=Massilia brevitalea TaxID=442526 RepID=UPI0027395A7A|nr:hypothetical protein [Massilia brevitalea]
MRIAAIAAFGSTLVACGGGGGGSGSNTSLASTSASIPAPAAVATPAPEAAIPASSTDPEAIELTEENTGSNAAPESEPAEAETTVPAIPVPIGTGPVATAPVATVPVGTAPVADVPASGAITAPISGSIPAPMPAAIAPIVPVATPAPSYAVYGPVTDVRLQNTGTAAQANAPVTFGQVFAAGDLQRNEMLVGRLDNGTMVPLQLDVKASHLDGSVRHAVISAILPGLAINETRTMALLKTNAPNDPGSMSPKALLSNGFSASVHATINGVEYRASADDLIKSGRKYNTWLSGAVANEWQVSAPLTSATGVEHPHLTARFAIRWYDSIKKARVDVTLENNWAYEPNPSNITYDAKVVVRGQEMYNKPALTHFHHSRWRKLFWWGQAPQVHVRQNTAYLIASRAVPNFDQSVVTPESALTALMSKWTGSAIEPMGVGLANPYMPSTGGRNDLGIMPGWAATYLLSMDPRAKTVTLGTADLAGSWSAHYRDKNTDRPVSLIDYPYMTVLGTPTDTKNPATKQLEAFPKCMTGASCTSTNVHDSSHQPGFAYLPYLLTGDYYYLEELQFWAMYNVFMSNPGYRQNVKGLVYRDQVRGQAWSLRTLAEAAYITPDNDRLKAHFTGILADNMEWYNNNYTNNTAANVFGVIDHIGAVIYNSKRGIAPWQDDFFTSAIGHAAELGYDGARTFLAWKAKAPVLRMTQMCWIDASLYSMNLRDSETSPLYTTMAQVVEASQSEGFRALACNSSAMASFLKLKVGEMTGYASSVAGYPSNMQPALAYSVDARLPNGAAAWTMFMARTVKPNYGLSPQFAIVPR